MDGCSDEADERRVNNDPERVCLPKNPEKQAATTIAAVTTRVTASRANDRDPHFVQVNLPTNQASLWQSWAHCLQASAQALHSGVLS